MKPQFIYKRAPGLRNRIALNVPYPPKSLSTFLDREGFHYCTRCKACRTSKRTKRKIESFQSVVTKHNFKIKSLITCDSENVTYVLEHPCPKKYVGRTTRKLRVRINEHIANITNGFPKHSVSNHFSLFHNQDLTLLTFYGINKVKNIGEGQI